MRAQRWPPRRHSRCGGACRRHRTPRKTLAAAANGETVDLGGHLLLPPFVEATTSISDTSFVGDDGSLIVPAPNGFDVRERVAFQRELMATAAPKDYRAARRSISALHRERCACAATSNVDAAVGLKHLEAILPVREATAT